MLEMVKAQGACCDVCCDGSKAYHDSPIYQAFEEAEENSHC